MSLVGSMPKPRRKIVTYGNASQKRCFNYQRRDSFSTTQGKRRKVSHQALSSGGQISSPTSEGSTGPDTSSPRAPKPLYERTLPARKNEMGDASRTAKSRTKIVQPKRDHRPVTGAFRPKGVDPVLSSSPSTAKKENSSKKRYHVSSHSARPGVKSMGFLGPASVEEDTFCSMEAELNDAEADSQRNASGETLSWTSLAESVTSATGGSSKSDQSFSGKSTPTPGQEHVPSHGSPRGQNVGSRMPPKSEEIAQAVQAQVSSGLAFKRSVANHSPPEVMDFGSMIPPGPTFSSKRQNTHSHPRRVRQIARQNPDCCDDDLHPAPESTLASAEGVPVSAKDVSRKTKPGRVSVEKSPPALSRQAKIPRVTYAARARTILKDTCDTFSLLPLDTDLGLPESPPRRALLADEVAEASRRGVFEIPDTVGDVPTGALKSVRELRQAGVNARTEKETEALIEDIRHSTSVFERQSSFLDLALKSQSETFLSQLATNGLAPRIYSLIGEATDAVCKTLLSSAIVRIISFLSDSDTSMLSPSKNLEFLEGTLNCADNMTTMTKSRNARFPKAATAMMSKLCSALQDSSIWTFGAPFQVTPRSLCLQCLYTISYRARLDGLDEKAIPPTIAEYLIDIMSSSTQSPDPDMHTASDTLLSLSILEMSSHDTRPQNSTTWEARFARLLGSLLSSAHWVEGGKAMQIWTGALRLSLNVTNNNVCICNEISETRAVQVILEMIQSSFEELSDGEWISEQDCKLDCLVLSLGVLINIAENGDQARAALSRGSSGLPSPLIVLLQIFKTHLQRAFEVNNV